MILLLAGTSDARELAVMIQHAGYDVTATVVTDHAAEQPEPRAFERTSGGWTPFSWPNSPKRKGRR